MFLSSVHFRVLFLFAYDFCFENMLREPVLHLHGNANTQSLTVQTVCGNDVT